MNKKINFILCTQFVHSYQYYTQPQFMGTLQLVEGLSSIIGLTLYNMFWKQVWYRTIFWTINYEFCGWLNS